MSELSEQIATILGRLWDDYQTGGMDMSKPAPIPSVPDAFRLDNLRDGRVVIVHVMEVPPVTEREDQMTHAADPGPEPTPPPPATLRERIRDTIVATTADVALTNAIWLDAITDAVLQVARDGADDTPIPDECEPNPGQWVAMFVDYPGDKRRLLATRVLEYAHTSQQCFMLDHIGRLHAAAAQVERATRTVTALADQRDRYAQALREILAMDEPDAIGPAHYVAEEALKS